LSEFSVARAVAASSAVPILFPPILIEKHQDCNFDRPAWLINAEKQAADSDNARLKELVRSMEFYLDDSNPSFATLVDGGVSDNLGLRAIVSNTMLAGGAEALFRSSSVTDTIKHVVIIVVNASTTAVTDIGKSQTLPTTFDVFNAVTDIQLHLYNIESNSLVKSDLIQLAQNVSRRDRTIVPLFIELSVDDLKSVEDEKFLNAIPTSFYLEKEQADRIIDAAKRLLRQDPDYRRLLKNLGARVPAGGT
jgi:NTE family protein